ncbi:hypothetical protein [uncultured Pseudoteredinibacter sp.]|uniref:hypothetical protein n=1 Tax=uncultured Pseudoteredinibacter sp. TaxID=1641701 RepID=UPI00261EB6AF|nr:hypothetical protein [uncultured Pseudoteredinibacter sp.]
MDSNILERRLKFYYITVVLSVFSACVSFAYNAWRLEISEDNSTTRTAAFQVLLKLSELEQGMYSLHYDRQESWTPRNGWVAVVLVKDLSMLIGEDAKREADALHQAWSDQWGRLDQDEAAIKLMVNKIDKLRQAITLRLARLE